MWCSGCRKELPFGEFEMTQKICKTDNKFLDRIYFQAKHQGKL